mgnify:CR=1 FL=1
MQKGNKKNLRKEKKITSQEYYKNISKIFQKCVDIF